MSETRSRALRHFHHAPPPTTSSSHATGATFTQQHSTPLTVGLVVVRQHRNEEVYTCICATAGCAISQTWTCAPARSRYLPAKAMANQDSRLGAFACPGSRGIWVLYSGYCDARAENMAEISRPRSVSPLCFCAAHRETWTRIRIRGRRGTTTLIHPCGCCDTQPDEPKAHVIRPCPPVVRIHCDVTGNLEGAVAQLRCVQGRHRPCERPYTPLYSVHH
ncbi:hypothetical protein GY45DRAFT_147780 [Cubamyces sp. BRFM 1775]|nr:hypothetical protein GY45DRAFT_147780 [Cubamyces sp. BRFM 1775]